MAIEGNRTVLDALEHVRAQLTAAPGLSTPDFAVVAMESFFERWMAAETCVKAVQAAPRKRRIGLLVNVSARAWVLATERHATTSLLVDVAMLAFACHETDQIRLCAVVFSC